MVANGSVFAPSTPAPTALVIDVRGEPIAVGSLDDAWARAGAKAAAFRVADQDALKLRIELGHWLLALKQVTDFGAWQWRLRGIKVHPKMATRAMGLAKAQLDGRLGTLPDSLHKAEQAAGLRTTPGNLRTDWSAVTARDSDDDEPELGETWSGLTELELEIAERNGIDPDAPDAFERVAEIMEADQALEIDAGTPKGGVDQGRVPGDRPQAAAPAAEGRRDRTGADGPGMAWDDPAPQTTNTSAPVVAGPQLGLCSLYDAAEQVRRRSEELVAAAVDADLPSDREARVRDNLARIEQLMDETSHLLEVA